MDYDMVPTAHLRGLHFRGVVEQRIIANYAVDPGALQALVPADATLWTEQGRAWLSACFVQMRNVRPAGAPAFAGLSMRYLVHRTMAAVPFPDGRRRKAVVVLQAFGDPFVPRVLARVLGGAPFQPARIDWTHGSDTHRVQARVAGDVVYDATSRPGFHSRAFSSVADADEAILGMAWGSHRGDAAWSLFPETHDSWQAYGLDVKTSVHAFRDRLGLDVEADHAIGMADCPHEFGRPIRVRAT